jgi:hypothetical protein
VVSYVYLEPRSHMSDALFLLAFGLMVACYGYALSDT